MDDVRVTGFKAAGVAAGIKNAEKKELGLIVSEQPAAVAGVFTRNRVSAAPVKISRRCTARGVCRALIVNSGNANCCTGDQGMADARRMAHLAGEQVGAAAEEVLVASTGVIGEPLPMDRIAEAVPTLAGALTTGGFPQLAEAMMTTDTVPKLAFRRLETDAGSCAVVGVAKGAGMIHPDMATMLAFVCTDAGIDPATLQRMLSKAVAHSFNRITIDGDTSTNDMVVLMANGMSGVTLDNADALAGFQAALDDLLDNLARAMVADGEGATKLVEIAVRGAATAADAHKVANTVATSPLVKTALFGEDANWGRILAAAGRAGVDFDPDRVEIFFDDVKMFANGRGQGREAEAQATAVLKKPAYGITVDLGMGGAADRVYTCDLSVEYVRINADYRS